MLAKNALPINALHKKKLILFFFHKMLRVKYVCKLIRLCLYTPATNEAKLMSKSVVAD